MPPKAKRKPDDPAQYKRFLESARQAEADETEEGLIARSRPLLRRPKTNPAQSPRDDE